MLSSNFLISSVIPDIFLHIAAGLTYCCGGMLSPTLIHQHCLFLSDDSLNAVSALVCHLEACVRPSEVDHSCSSLMRLKSEDEERLVKK